MYFWRPNNYLRNYTTFYFIFYHYLFWHQLIHYYWHKKTIKYFKMRGGCDATFLKNLKIRLYRRKFAPPPPQKKKMSCTIWTSSVNTLYLHFWYLKKNTEKLYFKLYRVINLSLTPDSFDSAVHIFHILPWKISTLTGPILMSRNLKEPDFNQPVCQK